MSYDSEKKVVEATRRNHSDIHSITGNVIKTSTKGSKFNNESDVRNPMKALLIIAAAFGIIVVIVFLISKLIPIL